MWFIKVDDELTLENVCEANNMEPKALYNPMHEGVLNIILRDPEDITKTGNMVYTNITLNFENVGLQLKNGVPMVKQIKIYQGLIYIQMKKTMIQQMK